MSWSVVDSGHAASVMGLRSELDSEGRGRLKLPAIFNVLEY